jgi:hypothetical protein
MQRPLSVQTKSWEDCARRYHELPSQTPALVAIGELCDLVSRSPLRDLIFVATSMFDLLISQHTPIEWNNGVLRIAPAGENYLRFTLHEKSYAAPVVFECAADHGRETFDTFLRRHKWVSESAIPAAH